MNKDKQGINITFHNPNTSEETVKLLTKIIVQNVVNQIVNSRINFNLPDENDIK